MSPSFTFIPKEVRPVVGAASFGFAIVQLDVTIVNVALPRIGADLGAGMTGLQWIVDAYTLAFAALLLSAGAIGDRFGSKHTYLTGLIVFALSSMGCALAANSTVLIITRALQGVGAALLVPSSLALINHATGHDSKLRARSIALWTATSGVALASGPVIGAVLLQWLGWRSIFYVNLPLCIFGFWYSLRAITAPDVKASHPMDPWGQILAIVALTSLVGTVIEFRQLGGMHPLIIGGMLTALLSGVAFFIVEGKVHAPMLPLSFFRLPNFSAATVFGVMVNLTYYGVIFVISLYLQHVRGYTAMEAGLAYLPLTATFVGANLISGWLASRFGSRTPMVLGSTVGAIGFACLAAVTDTTPFYGMMISFVLIPGGMGMAVPAMTAAMLGAVDKSRAGTASAVLNTARQAGGAIGVALFGALASGSNKNISFGLKAAALTSVGLLLATAAIALVLIHPTRPATAATQR